MRVLFDTNVVLDVLLDREPHAGVAARLFALVDRERLDGVVCATTVTTIHYLAAKAIAVLPPAELEPHADLLHRPEAICLGVVHARWAAGLVALDEQQSLARTLSLAG